MGVPDLQLSLGLLWNVLSAWHSRHPHVLRDTLLSSNKWNTIFLIFDTSKHLPHPVKQGEASATSSCTLWLPCSPDGEEPLLGRRSNVPGSFLCAHA